MPILKFLVAVVLALSPLKNLYAQGKFLHADARPRPPEIVMDEKTGLIRLPAPVKFKLPR
ncbi:MAG: hypothetical protein ACEQSE_11905 [Candidatus Aquirickettsiella gammari]